MWGIIPAAGSGSRIQPLAFSKELLPVGSRRDGATERPRAVGEYLIERMLIAGADKICFVISPGKSDILEYFGGSVGGATLSYVVQPHPCGLCDAIFRAAPLIPADEPVAIGLPDTIWFPEDGLRGLSPEVFTFLTFPVERPEFFDAVVSDDHNRVRRVQVKSQNPETHWIWGAMLMPGQALHDLRSLWEERGRSDEFLGTLVNEYIARGGRVEASPVGASYVDVGTIDGYREALRLLSDQPDLEDTAPRILPAPRSGRRTLGAVFDYAAWGADAPGRESR